MSTQTKYYCDFRGCGEDLDKDTLYIEFYLRDGGNPGRQKDLCPDHAEYIFELFEKEKE